MSDARRKVLLVSHNHPHIKPGGAEGYALNLYEAIRDAGEFEPVFLARTGPAFMPPTEFRPPHPYSPITSVNDDPNQYLIHTDLTGFDTFFHRSPRKETATRDYYNFLLAHEPDIVHFQHNYMLGYDWLRVTKNALPDVPIVKMLHEYLPICFHDGQMIRTHSKALCTEQTPRRCHECFPMITPQKFKYRERFMKSHLALVDVFIAPSEYVKARYVDWGIPEEKIQVETYALPPSPHLENTEPRAKRNRFAFFGQFTPYKGTDVLLKAMGILGEDFDGHVWIHGANLETQAPHFQEEFRDLLEKTSGTVTFAGPYDHADELHRLMGATDWVVIPSIWWETGPLVALEAFQNGRPVICSNIGGMSEKVTDGINGLHFDVGDPESLARVLEQAAETPGLWDQMHAGIPPVYDIRDHAAVVSDLYRRALAGYPAASSNGTVTTPAEAVRA
jgi:glycosyltransferase involved in cell wall biosynthesis